MRQAFNVIEAEGTAQRASSLAAGGAQGRA
jgi:hypothetical protein